MGSMMCSPGSSIFGMLEAAYAEFEERVEALLDASLTKAE